MPRFAANLSLLFTERPYADRFAAARTAGFEAVEVLFPCAETATTRAGLAAQDFDLVLMNVPNPDPATGMLGRAATPGAETALRAELSGALACAAVLRPGLIHVMSGDGSGREARDTFVANLQWLADTAPEQHFTIEPLNPRDRPGYFLNDYGLAAEILAQVDRPNLGLQYDTYHAHLIHGDALAVWDSFGALAAHVQIGNPPDRSDPGPGPVDFPAFFDRLDSDGYTGWVSAEYTPKGRTEGGLGWMPPRT